MENHVVEETAFQKTLRGSKMFLEANGYDDSMPHAEVSKRSDEEILASLSGQLNKDDEIDDTKVYVIKKKNPNSSLISLVNESIWKREGELDNLDELSVKETAFQKTLRGSKMFLKANGYEVGDSHPVIRERSKEEVIALINESLKASRERLYKLAEIYGTSPMEVFNDEDKAISLRKRFR